MKNIFRILKGLFTTENISDDEMRIAVGIIALIIIGAAIIYLF